jgi:hypothetical protein
MPVFVMQNGGVYYSGTMLLWAIGWQERPYRLFHYICDHGNRKGKAELARENAVEQPMQREWWAAMWKEEMMGIGTVGEVIRGAPIDPHLQLEGQEAADGASTSAAGAVGRVEGGVLAPLLAFASFDSVLGHLGDMAVQGPELAKLAFSAALAGNIPVLENLCRAQHQLKAIQGDAEGFRAASLELLSKAIDAAPKLKDGAFDAMQARAKAWEAEREEVEGEEEIEGEAEVEEGAEEGGTGVAILAQGWPNGYKEESLYSTKCGAEGFNARLSSPTSSLQLASPVAQV